MPAQTRVVVGAAIAAGMLTVALLVLARSDGSPSAPDSSPRSPPPNAQVRGCRQRVEGGEIAPDPQRDTVIAPIAFIDLAGSYRDHASGRDSEVRPYPGIGMPAIKVIAVVRAGSRVTLAVPHEQRRWMKLIYEYPVNQGEYAITLHACRRSTSRQAQRRECHWRPDVACRWRYTQFSGGFGLDLENAPHRGACAELIVWVNGGSAPLRKALFRPRPDVCS